MQQGVSLANKAQQFDQYITLRFHACLLFLSAAEALEGVVSS